MPTLPFVSIRIASKPPLSPYSYLVLELDTSKIIIVVGHQRKLIKEKLKIHPDIEFAIQEKQKGTAHAVKMCFDNLKKFAEARGKVKLIFENKTTILSNKLFI